MKTEKEMREEKAPTPKSSDELSSYIEALVNRDHDYGTRVYAMSLAATAAFNYVASKLRVTGFQASCADLDILRHTRMMEGPFAIIDGANMLYPQYNLVENLKINIEEWRGWAKEEAIKKLKENDVEHVHPDVLAHWKMLAEYQKEIGEDEQGK